MRNTGKRSKRFFFLRAGWITIFTKLKPWSDGMEVVEDLKDDACSMQRAVKVKAGKSNDKWGKRVKKITQGHWKTNKSRLTRDSGRS